MTTLTFSKGEYGFNLSFTILNPDNSIKDLTGYTIKFVMKDNSVGTGRTGNVVVNAACSITSPATNGQCTYTVVSTDFNIPSNYLASLILTKSGDQEETIQFNMIIQASAGS